MGFAHTNVLSICEDGTYEPTGKEAPCTQVDSATSAVDCSADMQGKKKKRQAVSDSSDVDVEVTFVLRASDEAAICDELAASDDATSVTLLDTTEDGEGGLSTALLIALAAGGCVLLL